MKNKLERPYGIFQGKNGDYSMRRAIAFILAICSVGISIVGLINKLDWKALLAASGVPLAISLMLLLFTTWGDVKEVIEAIREGGKKDE